MMKYLLINLMLFAAAQKATVQPQEQIQGEKIFLSHTRQLTFEGARSGEGYFSPDGKLLIFQSEREPDNPFYQIYILDFQSGDIHRVSPGIGKTTCAYFRPGTDEVLFASTHHDPRAKSKQMAELEFRASGRQRRYTWDYDDQMEIYSAHRDGGRLRRLTDALGYDAEAAYSPDGQKIVFASLRHAYADRNLSPEDRKRLETDPAYFAEIYIMNADGSAPRRLTHTPGYDGGPFFSPEGRRILWRRFDEAGVVADIYSMNADGSDPRRLTDFGCMAWAPFFHPSGEYVIFTANKLGFGNFELYLVDAEGQREPIRLTFTEGFDGLPVFSPDGKKLCWTSTRTGEGKSQLFLADWNQAAARQTLGRSRGRLPNTGARAGDVPHLSGPSDLKQNALSSAITREDLRAHVAYLASDELAGRLSGSPGNQLASEYIAQRLREAGLTPCDNRNSFFQTYEFTSGVKAIAEANHLSVTIESTPPVESSFIVEKDFRPLSFADNAQVEGEVVFAGYGLLVPGKAGEGYDSYAGLDVSNKIVLALRYVPEEVGPQRRQEFNRYAALRYKAMIARERGAKAILIVTGPNSPNPGALAPLSFDSSLAGSGIIAASIGTNVAQTLLSASGKNLKSLQSDLDQENPHAPGGFLLPKARLKLATAVERVKKSDRNVIGCLPPVKESPTGQYIMIGAHYDHLGYGESGSRETKEESGQIHNGADDNASGVAVVLELAAALSAERRGHPGDFARGILFCLWSGEELGLIGSSYFAEHPVIGLSNMVAYINLDMVGRLRENKLNLQGVGSSKGWPRLLEKRNVAAGFDLALQEDPYLPTDVTTFYPKKLPVLSFFTGSHEDYHRPSDDLDKLNYEGLERITEFARGLLRDLAAGSEQLEYVKVERSASAGVRDNLRVYLGTIPDYSAEGPGVKLSGARSGSPADKAGLQAGDVIVEFAGQKIANIYDYTYALDAAKIGRPVEMVVLRQGKRVRLKVVPEARK